MKRRQRDALARATETDFVVLLVPHGSDLTMEDFESCDDLYDTDMSNGGSSRALKIGGTLTPEGLKERARMQKGSE